MNEAQEKVAQLLVDELLAAKREADPQRAHNASVELDRNGAAIEFKAEGVRWRFSE